MNNYTNVKHRKNLTLKCNPPHDCFNCPYKDCIAPSGAKRTQLEIEYLRNAGFDKYQEHKFKKG